MSLVVFFLLYEGFVQYLYVVSYRIDLLGHDTISNICTIPLDRLLKICKSYKNVTLISRIQVTSYFKYFLGTNVAII